MHITCQVAPCANGFAYRLNDVWSAPFSTVHTALSAARLAALGISSSMRRVKIVYPGVDGTWKTEYINPAHQRGGSIDYDVIKQFLKGAPL